jgi:hypothetical protein
MNARPCYRHLDRPFVVFLGLGPADLFAIVLGGAVLMVATNPIVGVLGGVALALGLKKLKEGKPRGYVFELFYRAGILDFAPAALRPPWLVRRSAWGGRGRILRLSPVPGASDDDAPEVRYYRGSRKYIA